MNTYTTYCEAKRCNEALVYQAADFKAAIDYLRSRGWTATERDEHGYESFCPMHRPVAVAS